MRRTQAPAPDALRGVLLRLPLTLLLAMAIWFALRPVLDRAVSALAEALVRAYEVPRVTRLVADRHWVELHRPDWPQGRELPRLPLTGVHFNTIVLLALALALPRPWSRRWLESLVMAWAVLLLTQVLNLAFEVKSVYATRLGAWSLAHYSRPAREVFGFLQVFSDLALRFAAPFVVWCGFNAEVLTGLIWGERRDSPARSTSSGGDSGSRAARSPSSWR